MVNNQIEITVKITGIICFWGLFVFRLNPLMGALKPQSNRPLYSNTVIGTLAVGLLHLIQRGKAWAGCEPAQSPPRCTCTKCNSQSFNGQCTNFILFDVAL